MFRIRQTVVDHKISVVIAQLENAAEERDLQPLGPILFDREGISVPGLPTGLLARFARRVEDLEGAGGIAASVFIFIVFDLLLQIARRVEGEHFKTHQVFFSGRPFLRRHDTFLLSRHKRLLKR